MGKQIDDLVLLAILQNKIKNAVDENKVDISKFATVKHFDNLETLTPAMIKDISENLYEILVDDYHRMVYVLLLRQSNIWTYVRLYSTGSGYVLFRKDGLHFTKLREDSNVTVDTEGNVTNTDCNVKLNIFPKPQDFILKAEKYNGVVFYCNFFTNTTDSIIYRFSSGIILDSSTETSQYKIVFASYNVKTAKVTFVEKVLT